MKKLGRAFFVVVFGPIVWLIYRMRAFGKSNVPRKGGVLLLSNHVSYIDSFMLYLTCPRHVHFVVLEDYAKIRSIGWFLRLFEAIPIRPQNAKEAIVRTVDALQSGALVCLFPEGGLTRLGVTTEFKKGFELIVRKSGCPVVPVYMDGLFESIFAYERERYFWKRPRGLSCPLRIAYGSPIPPEEATAERVRLAVWEQSAVAFSRRRELRRPLEVAAVRSLKRRRRSVLFAGQGREKGREWTRSRSLALAVAIARRWMALTDHGEGERVGVLLPSGPTTSLIHLGLVLAGRVPVSLPFTIDPKELEKVAASVVPLDIRRVVTSRTFLPHLIDFWQGEEGSFIDLASVVSAPGPVMGLLERVRAVLEPAWLTCWRLDLGRRDPDREAVGMVPRPGDAPIFLSAKELLRDTLRVHAANFARREDRVLAEGDISLPEGLVFGCWGAVLGRGRAVWRSLSQRDDDAALANVVRDHGITLLAGQESFYRNIASSLPKGRLKWGLVFGPADPEVLRETEERIGLPLARGLSWNGRILAMSRPDPNTGEGADHQAQRGRDPESPGRLLPGIAARIDEAGLRLRLSPEEEWLPGPAGARIDPEGFLRLPAVDGKAADSA